MDEILAIGAGVAWLLAFAQSAVATRGPRRWVAATRRAAGWPVNRAASRDRAAAVNLVMTRCRLDGAAYAATILDLAARGYLVLTGSQSGSLVGAPAPEAPPVSGLFLSERIVISDVRTWLAGTGSAPFEVLAEACSADVRGCWDPFEKAVRDEAQRDGLTGPRLSAGTRRILEAGAVAVGVLSYLAVHARPHTELWVALAAGFLAMVLPVTGTRWLGRQERLTTAGAALAGRHAPVRGDDPAALLAAGTVPAAAAQRLAYAVAAGVRVPVAGAVPGQFTGIRPGRRRAAYRAGVGGRRESTGRPQAAWSSCTGQWRLVEIPAPGISWRTPGRTPGRRLAPPPVTGFDGQVIARWLVHGRSEDDDSYLPCIAIDDGHRAWSFQVDIGVFGRAAPGDRVRARVEERSMSLLDLTPAGQAVPAGPMAWNPAGPAAWDPFARQPRLPEASWLLPADEVSEVLGQMVRTTDVPTPFGGAVIYRGSGVTVSITVVDGGLGALSSGPARRFGRRVPGVGDEAWILNRDRTAVVRVGTLTAKITINDRGRAGQRVTDQPGLISELAATMAARLGEHAA